MEPKTCPHPTCGHIWTPRKENPKKCPQCANPMWRSPRPKRKQLVVPIEEIVGKEVLEQAVDAHMMESPHKDPLTFINEKDSLSSAKARAEALLRQLV